MDTFVRNVSIIETCGYTKRKKAIRAMTRTESTAKLGSLENLSQFLLSELEIAANLSMCDKSFNLLTKARKSIHEAKRDIASAYGWELHKNFKGDKP